MKAKQLSNRCSSEVIARGARGRTSAGRTIFPLWWGTVKGKTWHLVLLKLLLLWTQTMHTCWKTNYKNIRRDQITTSYWQTVAHQAFEEKVIYKWISYRKRGSNSYLKLWTSIYSWFGQLLAVVGKGLACWRSLGKNKRKIWLEMMRGSWGLLEHILLHVAV